MGTWMALIVLFRPSEAILGLERAHDDHPPSRTGASGPSASYSILASRRTRQATSPADARSTRIPSCQETGSSR
jgi:hypothetical protein